MKQITDNMITLSGENFQCYQVGVHYGSASELKDVAEHTRNLAKRYQVQLQTLRDMVAKELHPDSPLHASLQELPNLAAALESTSTQLLARAASHSKAGREKLKLIQVDNPAPPIPIQGPDSLPRYWHRLTAIALMALAFVFALLYALGSSR
jgi:hypothetical protein